MKRVYLFSKIPCALSKILIIIFAAALFFCGNQNSLSQAGWVQQSSPANVDLASVSFVNEMTGYACGVDKIIKTTNGGATWFVFNTTPATTGYTKIQFVNQNTGFIACGNSEIYKTTNGGNSWVLMNSYSSKFGFVDNTFGWIFEYNHMNMTSDCGNTWYSGGYFYPFMTGGSLGSRNFGVVAGNLDDFMHNKMYMYIYRSLNGGSSWDCVSGGVYGDTCAYYVIYGFMPPPAFTTSYVVDDYIAFLYGGTQNFRSNNSGASWSYLNIGSSIAGFDFINHYTGYAVGGSGLIQYTTTSGSSWYQQTTSVSTQLNSIDMVNSLTGWAVGNSNIILKTTTGGIVLPLPPSLVSPVNNSTGIQLTTLLDWNDNLQAVNYRLQISTDINFSTTILDNNTIAVSQFNVPPGLLNNETNYYWRVSALNYIGWGPFSGAWNFRTFDLPAPVILSNPLNNSIEQPTDPTFKWFKAIETLSRQNIKTDKPVGQLSKPDIFNMTSGIDAINKYWFELTTDTISFSGLLRDTTISDTTKNVSGLNVATTYYWRVKANNPVGWGPFSSWWKFRTTLGLPQQTILFSPSNHSIQQPSNLVFKWYKTNEIFKDNVLGNQFENSKSTIFPNRVTENGDAITGYWFELTTDTVTLAGFISDSTLTDTTKTVSLSGISTTYYWRVKAKNQSGWGLFSPWWKFITIPAQFSWYLQVSNLGSNCEGIFFINPQTGWICSSTGSVYKTANGGDLWSLVFSNSDMRANDINFIDTLTGGISARHEVYSSTPWRSGDGGLTWTQTYGGYIESYYSSVTSINGMFCYCGYNRVAGGWPPPPGYSVIRFDIYDYSLGHAIPVNRIRSGPTETWTVGNQGIVYRGLSSCGVGNGSANLTGVSAPYQDITYVVGGNYMYKTINNGGSWTRMNPLDPLTTYNEVYFKNRDTGWVACTLQGGEGAIIGTTNGGTSWSLQYKGSYAGADFTFANSSTGWLLCGNSVLKTGNGGNPPHITSPILISPPNGITGLTVTPTLDWSDVPLAAKFRLQVTQQLYFSNSLIDDSSITLSQYTIPPALLNIGTKYYWRVAASNDTEWTQFSGIWNFTTRGMPLKVELSSPINNSTMQQTDITFSWHEANETLQKAGIDFQSDKPNAVKTDNHNIFSKEINTIDAIGNYWFELTSDTVTLAGLVRDSLLTDTVKSLSGLNFYAKYYWRVKANGDLGWGPFSGWWNFTTKTGIPLQVVLNNPPNNASYQHLDIAFVWFKAVETLFQPFEQKLLIDKSQKNNIKKFQSGIDAINSYWFELTTDTVTFAGLLRDTLLTDTIKILNTLNYAVTYYWRVKANGDSTWGPFSDWWNFTTIDGLPKQVFLYYPENYSIDQPTNLTFIWYTPLEILLKPYLRKDSDNSILLNTKNNIDAIGAYWFELTTDTVTLAGLVRDTTISDTTKTLNGLNLFTTYYWRVKAKNENGWGSFSDWRQFTTTDGLPKQVFLYYPENYSIDQPTSLTFIWYTPLEILLKPYLRKDSDNSILLNTKNNIDAIGAYWFELTTDTVTYSGLIRDTTIIDTTKAVSALSRATTYFWHIKARNPNGWGPFSGWWQFTTTDGLPKQVVLFSPENYSADQPINLTFSWYTPLEILLKPQIRNDIKRSSGKNNKDAISTYWFELTTDPETLADLIRDTTISDTTKGLSGLSRGTTYYWRVKAKSEFGWGPFSDWWQFTTTFEGLPEQVVLFSPENYSYDLSTSLTFTWYTPLEILLKRQLRNDIKRSVGKNNKDAISTYWYELTTDPENFTDLIQDTTLTDTTKDVSGLRGSTTYYWRVKAKNENGWGAFCDWWQFTTFYIATPELYLPENTATGIPITPVFDWSDAEGAESYLLQISTNPAFINPVLDSNEITGSEFYAMCGLLNYDTLYYWRVRANNVFGNSPWSEIWSFTVQAKPEWYLQCTGWQNSLLDIFFINVNTGWACGYGGIIKTTNGGSSWFPVNNGISFDCYSVFFINENTGWVADNNDLIYKTTNGGETWNYGAESGAYGTKSFDFINANTGYFTINNGYYSGISGKSYGGMFGFSYNQGLFKTTDGGIDWFFLDVPVTTNYNDVSFPDDGIIGYTCGGHGEYPGTGYILKTTNAGVNWTELDVTGSSQLIDLSFIDQLTGWAAGLSSTVLYTSNGGTNWASRNNSIADDLLSIHFINGNTGWTCSGYNIYKTTDAGINWTLTPNIYSGLTGITFKNSKGWISAENGVVLKNDSEEETPLPVLISPLNGAAGISLTPLLDWSDAAGAFKYRLQVSTDENFITTIVDDSNLTASQYSISSGLLSGNSIYYWRVKAKGNSGWGIYTTWWNFTTISSSPAPPVLVSPANNSAGNILPLLLIWNSSPTAVNYKLQLSTDSLFNTFIINDSTQADTSEVITSLNPLINYYWRVAAKNSGGWSAFSERWVFKTLGYPDQVTLAAPANNSVNQPVNINFSWFKAAEQQLNPFRKEVKKYDKNNLKKTNSNSIFIDESESIGNYWYELTTDTVTFAGLNKDTTLADTAKTVNGLSNSTAYYWRVKAKNEFGWGQFSLWWKFTTIISAPAAPNLYSPADNSTGNPVNLNLTWYKSVYAASYRIQLALDSNFSSMVVNDSTLTDSLKAVSGLSPLTYYYWRVNAKNTGGTSAYSPVWKFKTIGAPNRVILVSPANNAVNQPVNLIFTWRKAFDQTAAFKNRLIDNKVKKEILKNSKNISLNKSGYDNVNNYWFELTIDTVTYSNIIRDSLLTDSTKSVNGLIFNTSYFWRVKAKNEIGWGIFSVWFKFTTLTALNVNINYNTDWNMISIPVNANPNGVRSIFPTCTPPAFYYNNGYQSDTILIPGKGFWLFFNSGGNQNLTGLPVNPQIIPVTPDWNMIGAFESNVAVNSITSNPPGIINSSFFKYSNGYTTVDTLKPGVAYWVSVSQNGNLLIPSAIDGISTVFKERESQNNLNEYWVKIIISDNSGKRSELYLGRKEEMNNSYMLPPLPPMGIFDARFSSNSYVEMLGQNRHEVNIQTDKYPVKIKAENLTGLKLQIKDKITGKLVDRILTNNSEITVNEHINSFVLIEEELPKVFSLSQNYPNPFNPLTHIKYGIPQKVNVKMVLYDLLGREVIVLVNGTQDAGYYTVDLYADDIASGVYFYRIVAGSFTDVKKLLVIK